MNRESRHTIQEAIIDGVQSVSTDVDVPRASRRSRWVPYVRPRAGARVRLIGFPHAGGSASAFRSWENVLPPDIEVCGVQLPGRETRWAEAPLDDLAALLEAVGPALEPWTETPFCLFGHSLGGLIAFELARWQRRHGLPGPVGLFVAGSPAPQTPRSNPLHGLPREDFVAGLRRLGTVPEELLGNDELLDLVLPTLRADFRVFETYEHRTEHPLACPISILGGEKDQLVPVGELEGWRVHTDSVAAVRLFPGGHFFLQDARADVLETVAQDLAAWLWGGAG